MDFLDNVVKSSNAIIKDKIKTPLSNFDQSKLTKPFNTFIGNKDAATRQASATADDISGELLAQQTNQQPTTSQQQQQQQPQQQQQQQQQQQLESNNQQQQQSDIKVQFDSIAADAQAVGQKTVEGAKNIGNFLFSMSVKASQSVSQSVSQTASKVKQAVDRTITTDSTTTGQLPWSDLQLDEQRKLAVKEQVLALSQDRRNFVRAPPASANFVYDAKTCYPIAQAMLKEDSNLVQLKQELVPKFVSEDQFWCNYFYRIEMLKRLELVGDDAKQLQQQQSTTNAGKIGGWTSSRSSSGEGPDIGTDVDSVAGNYVQANNAPANEDLNRGFDERVAPSTPKSTPTSTFDASIDVSTERDDEKRVSLDGESKKLIEEAESLKSRLKALNIGSFDEQ